MKMATLVSVFLLITGGVASADSVSWIHGENPPDFSTVPDCPTAEDPINFSVPTDIFANQWVAEWNMGGTPTLSIDPVDRTIRLWIQGPPPAGPPPTLWDPVCGLEGDFGPLEEGTWVFDCRLPGVIWFREIVITPHENGRVGFEGTVTAHEKRGVFPVCYGDYFVQVAIDEVIEDAGNLLACRTSVEVCYDRPLGLRLGEEVEVYGWYYGGVCPLQYCGRVKAYGDSYYIIRRETVIPPTVTTQNATLVKKNSATLWGKIADDGGQACEYRFRYKKEGGSWIETLWTGSKTTGQSFSQSISGLSSDSSYYFNAQAQNSAGTSSWGDLRSFRTLPDVEPPTVRTDEATDIKATSATLWGTIVDDGGQACEYRFWYKKEGGASKYTSWTGSKTTGQSFSQEIGGLYQDCLYHFRVQAKNSAGEGNWGGLRSFRTAPPDGRPTVKTKPATDVDRTTATLWGTIVDDGGQACEYRFWYKKEGGASKYTSWTGSKTTGQSFSKDIGGLYPNCLYHFRAQARNSAGEGHWGEKESFSTHTPGYVIFEDSFPWTTIDPNKWTVVEGATVDDVGINEPSPDYSLRLNGYPLGGDSVESKVIDLSSYSGATLTYHYERKGGGNSTETEEDLIIYYWNGSSWIELDSQPGDGPDMTNYEKITIVLPPEALHTNFKLRIQSTGTLGLGSDVFDDWFIDDVKIEVVDDHDVFPLVAHWKLDEIEGAIAYDSAGDNDSILYGDPIWQPAGGMLDGGLQFDGIDDYGNAGFVLNPRDEAFTVLAWVKGGKPGEVFISQTDGTDGFGGTWLGTNPSNGKLITKLMFYELGSEVVITDEQWHLIGLVWDGLRRYLYVDGELVAGDASDVFAIQSDGDLYIGAGKTLGADTFFSGLIDDVRIYNQALSTEEIEMLTR